MQQPFEPSSPAARHRLVLIRHGQTDWSRDGRHTGRTDISLNAQGEYEADLVIPTLAGWEFAAAVSSPLRRARQTAERAGFGDGLVIVDALMEWDYGDAEGRTNAALTAERPGWSKWTDGVTGGESVAQVGQRADAAIAAVAGHLESGDVVVFAHGHLLSVLIARWLGLSAQEGRRFVLDTATISVLGQKRTDRVLRLFNHRCGHAVAVEP